MTISKRISLCFLIQTVVYRSNVTPSVLERSSPSDQIKNQNDKRNHEQQMNKSAANMSERPTSQRTRRITKIIQSINLFRLLIRTSRQSRPSKRISRTAKLPISCELAKMRSVPFWIDTAPVRRFPRIRRNTNLDVIVIGSMEAGLAGALHSIR